MRVEEDGGRLGLESAPGLWPEFRRLRSEQHLEVQPPEVLLTRESIGAGVRHCHCCRQPHGLKTRGSHKKSTSLGSFLSLLAPHSSPLEGRKLPLAKLTQHHQFWRCFPQISHGNFSFQPIVVSPTIAWKSGENIVNGKRNHHRFDNLLHSFKPPQLPISPPSIKPSNTQLPSISSTVNDGVDCPG